MIDDGNIMIHY